MPDTEPKQEEEVQRGLTSPGRREDARALWAIAWRAVLFGPIVVPLGYAALILAIASLLLPPIYAIVCLVSGDLLLGVAVAVGYALWLRYGGRLLKPVFQNWRDDG